MSHVMELFDEFKREFRRVGFADPRSFLAKASANDRPTLSVLIDTYLEAGPLAPADEGAYADSAAKRLVDVLDQGVGESTGLWPQVLPLLRKRADLRRKDVVARLTKDLDLQGGEDLVRAAFHEMESGLVDSEDVQTPVLEALGRMLGESAETIRSLGRRLGPASARRGPAAAFARGSGTASHLHASCHEELQTDDPGRRRLERRVDELFRGGGASVE